jgi:two-component system, chemotaxis family, protein-glutamate methylesterase/glutaminase
MVQHSRPSIDVLFESAADTFGERAIAVILTGANADGACGVQRVKRRGGVTIVQDPQTAAKRTMPDAAIATGAVDHVAPLERIGPLLGELAA